MLASAAGEHGVEPPLQASGVELLTSATLPPVALMLIGVASVSDGPGSGTPVAPPEASCTSTYCPGESSSPERRGVIRFVAEPKFPVPVALEYWIDQPDRSTSAVLLLKSST